MTCAPTDRLLQTLKVEAPGATDAVIELQLFNVIDEFFRRTSAWRHSTDIMLSAGNAEYDLATPADSTTVRILGVVHNGQPISAVTTSGSAVSSSLGRLAPEETFPDGDANFQPQVIGPQQGVSSFSYAIFRPQYITLTSSPDAEAAKYPMQVLLALSISPGCLENNCADWQLDEWMYDMFFQEWLDGSLGRLMMMPSKPWSNPTLGAYHHKRFRNGMAYRKQEAPKGFNHGVPGWRFPGTWTR